MGQSQSQGEAIRESLHYCTTCDLHFPSKNEWSDHELNDASHLQRIVDRRTPPKRTQCSACDTYVEDSDILYHRVVECVRARRTQEEGLSGGSSRRCGRCERRFDDFEALLEHRVSDVCDPVRLQIPDDDDVWDASSNHERHVCTTCDDSFPTANDLREHEFVFFCGRERTQEDAPTIFHCEQCDSYFTFEDDFLLHLQDCDIPAAPSHDEVEPEVQVQKTSSADSNPNPKHKPSGDRAFECPVCMEEQSHLSSVPCGHVFCTSCIGAALRADKRCPVCRSSAREADLRRIFLYGSG